MRGFVRAGSVRRFVVLGWLVAGMALGALLATAWQAWAGGPTYNPLLDVDHNGIVNTVDIQTTASAFNTTGDPALVNLVARGYYQTSAVVTGDAALSACTTGYHMANMAEIFNTSVLRYAKEIPGAAVAQDSGNGPPFSITGWIRTGVSTNFSNQVGAGNCRLWTSNTATDNGTTVALQPNWLVTGTNLSPWDGLSAACNLTRRVWCVQD